ncbi:MAG: glycosyltransferase family 2 protein [Oscillochloris sp.]|nr:glycosyltransferase family 2 protein [Oscillochloris sp.]
MIQPASHDRLETEVYCNDAQKHVTSDQGGQSIHTMSADHPEAGGALGPEIILFRRPAIDKRPTAPAKDDGAIWPKATVALIPAYNEERFIGSLVIAALVYVDHVIVVDDGSADQTAQIAYDAGAVVLRHTQNQGKAAAVNTGFSYLRGFDPAVIVMLDGDGQHSVNDIPAVIAPVLTGMADLVIGSRFMDTKSDIPAYRQVGQHGLTITTNLTSGVWVGDSQSGFRAFSAEAIERLSFSQGGFSLESEMQFLAGELKLRVAEVPISVTYSEPPKRNPFKHGMQVLDGILRLVGRTRPLFFFGSSGVFVLLVGLLLGLYITKTFMTTGELAIGYGLITVILFVTGVVLLFAGVLLHSILAMMRENQRYIVERISWPARVRLAPDELNTSAMSSSLREREVGR